MAGLVDATEEELLRAWTHGGARDLAAPAKAKNCHNPVIRYGSVRAIPAHLGKADAD